jgi:hypothetical protein
MDKCIQRPVSTTRVCEDTLILDQGEQVATGDSEQQTFMRSPLLRALFAHVNRYRDATEPRDTSSGVQV